MDEFDKIAEEAWEAPSEELLELEELFSAAWDEGSQKLFSELMDGWEEGDPAPTFTIYDPITGLPDKCHLCGQADDWVCRGTYFSCEHGLVHIMRGAILAQSTRPILKMVRKPELTGRFRLQRLHLYGEEEDVSTWDRKP